MRVLDRLAPDVGEALRADARQFPSWGVTFTSPGGTSLRVPFSRNTGEGAAPGSIMPRMDFDQLLFEKASKANGIEVVQGVTLNNFTRTADGWLVTDQAKSIEHSRTPGDRCRWSQLALRPACRGHRDGTSTSLCRCARVLQRRQRPGPARLHRAHLPEGAAARLPVDLSATERARERGSGPAQRCGAQATHGPEGYVEAVDRLASATEAPLRERAARRRHPRPRTSIGQQATCAQWRWLSTRGRRRAPHRPLHRRRHQPCHDQRHARRGCRGGMV